MEPPNPNIEAFNALCVQLFADLYDAFPVPIDIEPNALAMAVQPDQEDYGGTWSVMEIAGETVNFLRDEGFLRYRDRVLSGEFGGVRLTMKGLAVLGIPVSLKPNEPREPMIQKMKRVAAKGGEKIAADALQKLVSEAFRFGLSALSGGARAAFGHER